MRANQRIYVYVELGLDAQPVRIFRNQKASIRAGWRQIYPRADAVAIIRHKIFLRSKGDCELCGVHVTESSGHLHEQVHRGKGGEISLSNSVFICYACHLGPRGAHRDRRARFGEHDSDKKEIG